MAAQQMARIVPPNHPQINGQCGQALQSFLIIPPDAPHAIQEDALPPGQPAHSFTDTESDPPPLHLYTTDARKGVLLLRESTSSKLLSNSYILF